MYIKLKNILNINIQKIIKLIYFINKIILKKKKKKYIYIYKYILKIKKYKKKY